MKIIEIGNVTIELEVYDRFHYLTRAYREERGEVRFLGKYIIGTRTCDIDEVIAIYTK